MRIPLVSPPRRAAAGVAAALILAILLGAGPPTAWATPAAVNLGAAAAFAVLAGGGVTDTGSSVIAGDVGTYPLPAISDLVDRQAAGTVDRAGLASQRAQRDLARALKTTAALQPIGTVGLAERPSLPPGVYTVTDGEQGVVAALTLDGQGAVSPVWVFVVAKDLTTAPGSTVTLLNGAQACNVFWLVGGSATLGPASTFVGSVLAAASVSVGSKVTVSGRLLARTGAVSLSGATISVPHCTQTPAKAAPEPGAGALTLTSSPRDITPGRPAPAHAILPIVMLALLVGAAVFAEPHNRRLPSARRRW